MSTDKGKRAVRLLQQLWLANAPRANCFSNSCYIASDASLCPFTGFQTSYTSSRALWHTPNNGNTSSERSATSLLLQTLHITWSDGRQCRATKLPEHLDTTPSYRSISTSTISCASKKRVKDVAARMLKPSNNDPDNELSPTSPTITHPPTRMQLQQMTESQAVAALEQQFGQVNHRQPVDLHAKVQEFMSALECSPGQAYRVISRHPRLLTLPPGVVQHRVQQAAAQLQCSLPSAQKLLRLHPNLLALQPEHLKQQYCHVVAFLQQDLCMGEEEACSKVLKAGNITGMRVSTLRSKLAALADLCGSEARARELARGQVLLLKLKSESVASHHKQVAALAASHPSWQAAWDSISPGSFYLALRRATVERLQYVASRGQQGQVALGTLVCMHDVDRWHNLQQKLEQHQAGQRHRLDVE